MSVAMKTMTTTTTGAVVAVVIVVTGTAMATMAAVGENQGSGDRNTDGEYLLLLQQRQKN